MDKLQWNLLWKLFFYKLVSFSAKYIINDLKSPLKKILLRSIALSTSCVLKLILLSQGNYTNWIWIKSYSVYNIPIKLCNIFCSAHLSFQLCFIFFKFLTNEFKNDYVHFVFCLKYIFLVFTVEKKSCFYLFDKKKK